jgi:hypothetical protein
VLRELSEGAWVRVDESGYVLRRVELYWAWRLVELPEDWLRPLEQRFAQQRWLDLEDYVALAGRMTDVQVDYYKRDSVSLSWTFPIWLTVRFPWETLTQSLRGLRFLASLSATQRRQLLSGDWIPASTLTLPQRQRFKQALEDNFPPPEQLLKIDFHYKWYDWHRTEALGSSSEVSTTQLLSIDTAAFRLKHYSEHPLRYDIVAEKGLRSGAYISREDDLPLSEIAPEEREYWQRQRERWRIESLLEDFKKGGAGRMCTLFVRKATRWSCKRHPRDAEPTTSSSDARNLSMCARWRRDSRSWRSQMRIPKPTDPEDESAWRAFFRACERHHESLRGRVPEHALALLKLEGVDDGSSRRS